MKNMAGPTRIWPIVAWGALLGLVLVELGVYAYFTSRPASWRSGMAGYVWFGRFLQATLLFGLLGAILGGGFFFLVAICVRRYKAGPKAGGENATTNKQ
jgi:hypothetical protein